MRRTAALLLAFVYLFGTGFQPVSAAGLDDIPSASVGSGFSEKWPTPQWSLSAIRGYKPLAPGKVGQGDHPLCSSATDPHCADSTNILADLVVPPCYRATDRFCIEGLEIGIEGQSVQPASLSREMKSGATPADTKLGLPAGGSASLWSAPLKHQGGTGEYAVVVTGSYSKSKDAAEFSAFRFQAHVYPVTQKSGKYCSYEIYEVIDQFGEQNTSSRLTGNDCTSPAYGECILTEAGFCIQPAELQPNTRVALSLRMDNKVTGWIFGRMKDVAMKTTALDPKHNLLRVEATSLNLMSAKAWVKKADAKNYSLLWENITTKWFLIKKEFDDWLASSGSSWGDMNPVGSFEQFAMWEPLLKPEAKDNWRWNFAASNYNIANSDTCLDKVGRDKIVGLVTTNAPIYDGGAPRFVDGFLQYKVAGLHRNADDSLFKGTYDMVIRSDFARCLYGFSSAPLSATVSIIAADGSTQNVATENVNERDGWIYLIARNFTFSSPTMKVKLQQDQPASAVKPAVAPKPTSAPKPVAKKVTITCVKGKTIKRVTAVKPTCPSGFRRA